MTCQVFIEYVNRKIYPFMLNEKGRERFEGIYAQYPGSFIVEHIERWTGEHFSYDRFGQPTEQTAAELLEKIDKRISMIIGTESGLKECSGFT